MRRLFVALLLLLSACAFAGVGETALEGATSQPPGFARESGAPAAEQGQVTGEPQAATDTAAAVEVAFLQADRQIVYVADMTVATEDVREAARRAVALVEAEGGFLFAEDTHNEPRPEAVLTFKVPPDRFRAVIDRLGELGELRSVQISADDVTERVVDLESRIRTTEASIARLRSLLAEATDIEGIVELERELAEREANLEVLRGELRTLSERVAMATLTLRLVQARADASLAGAITAYAGHDGGVACPGREQALSLERREPVTVCWEITNTGDTYLTDLRLTDPALEVELGDLIVVAGDPDRPLAPGDTLILAYETTGERRIRLRTAVEAAPATEDGSPIQGMTPAELQMTYTLDFFDPPGPPTFIDGLEASWELLLDLGGFGLAALGAALPFLWVVPLLWWGIRTVRRRPGKAEST